MSDSLWPRGLWPSRLPWDSPGKNARVVCHFLLQGLFLTQGLNPGLPHCRQTLFHLSSQASPEALYSVPSLTGESREPWVGQLMTVSKKLQATGSSWWVSMNLPQIKAKSHECSSQWHHRQGRGLDDSCGHTPQRLCPTSRETLQRKGQEIKYSPSIFIHELMFCWDSEQLWTRESKQ